MAEINVSTDPASTLAQSLVELLETIPACAIAVSGGSTPRELFRILASAYRDRVAWDKVTLFQVDERCVPPDHPQSNWKMIQEELLSKLPRISAHRMAAEQTSAAEHYETLIRRHVANNPEGMPHFDVILLGMGADGHTASLFPSTHALDERKRLVVLNDVPQLQTKRVTMTYRLINAAAHRWFLVRGADKATAFRQAQQHQVPAGRILNPVWFIDPDACGEC